MVIEQYPNSSKILDSYLMKGRVFLKLKQPENAKKILKRLMELYPKTGAAEKAGKMLVDMESH